MKNLGLIAIFLLNIFFSNNTIAQTSKENRAMIAGLISTLLKQNPTSQGGVSKINVTDEKFIVEKFDRENNLWSRSEAYFDDLKTIGIGNKYDRVSLGCEADFKCVKMTSTLSWVITHPNNFNTPKSIYEIQIEPSYIKSMTLDFTPDSHVANDLKELLIELLKPQ